MNSSKSGAVVVEETGVHGKSFGALESALSAGSGYAQALGTSSAIVPPRHRVRSLLVIPEAMVDQLTLADGIAILRHVLPKFVSIE